MNLCVVLSVLILSFTKTFLGSSEFDFNNLKTFLINLDERNDKYLVSKYQLDLLGLNFTRIKAVDGFQLIKDVKDNSTNFDLKIETGISGLNVSVDSLKNSEYNGGGIGCWLSHLKVYQTINNSVEANNPILILEDDFLADGDAIKLMKKFANSVPNDWDLLYVGHCDNSSKCQRHTGLRGEFCLANQLVICTHAYLLRNASVAMKLFKSGNSPSPILADFYFQTAGLKRYMIFPHIFSQRKNIASDVKSDGGIFTALLNDTIKTLINQKFK